MNNLKENFILWIDFSAQNNVKINTKNKQINYEHAAVEKLLETECPVYSLTIGDDKTEIPLTSYNKPYNITRRKEIEIHDNIIASHYIHKTYKNPIILNQKGADYKRPTITTETYDTVPLSGYDLLD